MTIGLEIRAQIDSENVKGLLLINGGGAVALLAFLPTILGKPPFESLLRAIVWALFAFYVGVVAAVIHNRLRRVCSLHYEHHNYAPPPCSHIPAWIKFEQLKQPCICLRSIFFMWVSVLSFVLGGSVAASGALKVTGRVEQKQEVTCWQLQEFRKQTFRVNQCTGTFERIELDSAPPNTSVNRTPGKWGASPRSPSRGRRLPSRWAPYARTHHQRRASWKALRSSKLQAKRLVSNSM